MIQTPTMKTLLLVAASCLLGLPAVAIQDCDEAAPPPNCPFSASLRAKACVVGTVCVGENVRNALQVYRFVDFNPSQQIPVSSYIVTPEIPTEYGPLEVTITGIAAPCDIYGSSQPYPAMTVTVNVTPEGPCDSCLPTSVDWICNVYDPMPDGWNRALADQGGLVFWNQHMFSFSALSIPTGGYLNCRERLKKYVVTKIGILGDESPEGEQNWLEERVFNPSGPGEYYEMAADIICSDYSGYCFAPLELAVLGDTYAFGEPVVSDDDLVLLVRPLGSPLEPPAKYVFRVEVTHH